MGFGFHHTFRGVMMWWIRSMVWRIHWLKWVSIGIWCLQLLCNFVCLFSICFSFLPFHIWKDPTVVVSLTAFDGCMSFFECCIVIERQEKRKKEEMLGLGCVRLFEPLTKAQAWPQRTLALTDLAKIGLDLSGIGRAGPSCTPTWSWNILRTNHLPP